MIKRLRFDADGVDHLAAPDHVRPLRVTVANALGDGARHEVLVAEWFRDAEHLDGFDRSSAGPASAEGLLVEEVVLRGDDWLEQRWSGGGDVLKHVALAVRADGLSPEEFSAQWRGHAGKIDRPGQATPAPIPADVRGEAYVQNHPRLDGPRPYDAVNEVYFADLAGLGRRVEWFRANEVGTPDHLFGRSWFLAMRESLVLP